MPPSVPLVQTGSLDVMLYRGELGEQDGPRKEGSQLLASRATPWSSGLKPQHFHEEVSCFYFVVREGLAVQHEPRTHYLGQAGLKVVLIFLPCLPETGKLQKDIFKETIHLKQ